MFWWLHGISTTRSMIFSSETPSSSNPQSWEEEHSSEYHTTKMAQCGTPDLFLILWLMLLHRVPPIVDPPTQPPVTLPFRTHKGYSSFLFCTQGCLSYCHHLCRVCFWASCLVGHLFLSWGRRSSWGPEPAFFLGEFLFITSRTLGVHSLLY